MKSKSMKKKLIRLKYWQKLHFLNYMVKGVEIIWKSIMKLRIPIDNSFSNIFSLTVLPGKDINL